MKVDLKPKILAQYQLQDNADHPFIEDSLTGLVVWPADFAFNVVGDWTLDGPWTISGGQLHWPYPVYGARWAKSKDVVPVESGENLRWAIKAGLAASGKTFFAYAGGTTAWIGYFSQNWLVDKTVLMGGSDTIIGFGTTDATPPAVDFDALAFHSLDLYPRTGFMKTLTPYNAECTSAEVSTTPGKVQARCFEWSGSGLPELCLNVYEAGAKTKAVVFWLYLPDTGNEGAILELQYGDYKVIVDGEALFISGLTLEEYTAYINNVETNIVPIAEWCLVVLNIDRNISAGNIVVRSEDDATKENFRIELIEAFKEQLTADERAFLWNSGAGTIELESDLLRGELVSSAMMVNEPLDGARLLGELGESELMVGELSKVRG